MKDLEAKFVHAKHIDIGIYISINIDIGLYTHTLRAGTLQTNRGGENINKYLELYTNTLCTGTYCVHTHVHHDPLTNA